MHAFIEDEINRKILHGRIQKFLNGFRHSVNFIEDYKVVFGVLEKQPRIRQTIAVVAVLQIEVEGFSFFGDAQGQRGFADLARADERDRRLLAELYAARDRLSVDLLGRRMMVEAFDAHPSDVRLVDELSAELDLVDDQLARLIA